MQRDSSTDPDGREYDGLQVAVTGGTGALGSAVVGRLLAAGAHCHVPNFADDELEHFAYRDHERVRLTTGIDLSRPADVDRFYGEIPDLWASIHCAGGFAMGPIGELDDDQYRKLVAMNVDSAYFCCRAAIGAIRGATRDSGPSDESSEETSDDQAATRALRPAGGRIVNVTARPGLEPRSGADMAAYTLAKAAVAALTQALAEEVADEKIWVNAIAPSIIDSPANRSAMPDADHDAWPTPEELAETLCFLASPRNGATRGACIPVYGRA